jgi:hypothetical protein
MDHIMSRRIRVKRGKMQGASFFESYHGEYGKPNGKDAKTLRFRYLASALEISEFGRFIATMGRFVRKRILPMSSISRNLRISRIR